MRRHQPMAKVITNRRGQVRKKICWFKKRKWIQGSWVYQGCRGIQTQVSGQDGEKSLETWGEVTDRNFILTVELTMHSTGTGLGKEEQVKGLLTFPVILLRYILYITKFIQLKCTNPWFWVTTQQFHHYHELVLKHPSLPPIVDPLWSPQLISIPIPKLKQSLLCFLSP